MSDNRTKPRRVGPIDGWSLVGWGTMIAGLFIALTLVMYGSGEYALRSAIRSTARIGAVLLSIIFAASALHTLVRKPWTKWLLRNRRYLGLAFGVIHLSHGVLILILAGVHSESFWAATSATSIVGGGIGYVFLIAMMATSFDRSASRLGRKRWVALHKSGIYVLWGIFVFSYLGLLAVSPLYIALLVWLLAAYALRLGAFLRRRRGKKGAL